VVDRARTAEFLRGLADVIGNRGSYGSAEQAVCDGLDVSENTTLTDGSTEIVSATTHGRNNRDLRAGYDGTRESTRIADVFIADENIDVFPHFSLLRCDAISNSWIELPECRQCLGQCCGWALDLHSTESGGKFPQRPRNVKSDWHGITCSAAAFCSSTALWFDVSATA
jgi:hypothetical protein